MGIGLVGCIYDLRKATSQLVKLANGDRNERTLSISYLRASTRSFHILSRSPSHI